MILVLVAIVIGMAAHLRFMYTNADIGRVELDRIELTKDVEKIKEYLGVEKVDVFVKSHYVKKNEPGENNL